MRGKEFICGEGGIRTLDTSLSSYNGLANRPFRPLRHLSKKGLRVFSGGEAKVKNNLVVSNPNFRPSFAGLWPRGRKTARASPPTHKKPIRRGWVHIMRG
jgi:hypothetical protein